MILTVTLNLALDVTYRVPRLVPGGTHRVDAVAGRAGGKGVNVSRVLAALGRETVVCGFAGGATGDAARADLAAAGLEAALAAIAGETRRTVTVVDRAEQHATGFWEPGPEVSSAEWGDLLTAFERLLGRASAVVLSGSLPPGVPPDAYALLIERAARAGVPALLDADDEALRRGVAAGPAVVKPNADELARVSGSADPVEAAGRLLDAGAGAVVASLGPDGMLALTPEGGWRALPPERLSGNATGAGDAAVAALAAGMVDGLPWPDRIAEAVALGAAAVASPLAGGFEPEVYRRHRDAAAVEALVAPGGNEVRALERGHREH